MTSDDRQLTVPQFTALKAAARKITMLTAYDYTAAQLVDAAGVEGILVGDSLGDGRPGPRQHAARDVGGDDLSCRNGRPGGAAGADGR